MKEKNNSLLQGTINISIDEYLKLKEFYEKGFENPDEKEQINISSNEEMDGIQMKVEN